jgi:hypothetical protein
MTDLENYLKEQNEQLNEQLSVAFQQAAIDQAAFDQLVVAFDQLSASHNRMVEAFDQMCALNDQLTLELEQMTPKSKRRFF